MHAGSLSALYRAHGCVKVCVTHVISAIHRSASAPPGTMPAELEDFSDEDDEEFKPDVRSLPDRHLTDTCQMVSIKCCRDAPALPQPLIAASAFDGYAAAW